MPWSRARLGLDHFICTEIILVPEFSMPEVGRQAIGFNSQFVLQLHPLDYTLAMARPDCSPCSGCILGFRVRSIRRSPVPTLTARPGCSPCWTASPVRRLTPAPPRPHAAPASASASASASATATATENATATASASHKQCRLWLLPIWPSR